VSHNGGRGLPRAAVDVSPGRRGDHVTIEAPISARLDGVRDRIVRAARRAGRPPDSVRLVAVSKTVPAEIVRAAAAAGQVDFGENKVQEALQKISATADRRIRWHFVGHLQSNKARKAAQAFACIHSVDRTDLIDRLDAAAAETGATPEVLIQVDLGREPTKHGAVEDQVRALFDRGGSCRAVRVVGLMTIPPFAEDPEASRPFFRRLREMRDELAGAGAPATTVRELSMGMSHDFEVAIDEGATIVRVGTAIFGPRGT
jgi:pyridoxal phosphate enzyme (YggS family)